MPTYQNSGTEIAIVVQPRYLTILPGAEVETSFYLRTLPENVTLTSHLPSTRTWTVLDSMSSYPSDDIDVSNTNNIIVFNATNNVTLSANDEDDNAIAVVANTLTVFDNRNGLLGMIKVLTGDGTTYVWGSQLEMKFTYYPAP